MYDTITYTLRTWPAAYDHMNSQTAGRTAAKALRELGWNENHTGGIAQFVTVHTEGSSGFGDQFTVRVFSDKAEEYAKQLWKDPRTTAVEVDGNNFPNPASEDSEELKAFKKKVFEVAKRTKREEGWCDSGFKDAMKELGIEVPPSKVRIVLEVDFEDTDIDPTNHTQIAEHLAYESGDYEFKQAIKSVEPIKD